MTRKTKKKKLLLFGGTFNPIHHAHLIIARTAVEQLGMDKVVFVPNGIPPHKKADPYPFHKLDMIRGIVGLRHNSIFDVSSYEIVKTTKAYTIETIRNFKECLGDSIDKPYWLIGPDNLEDLKNWYKIEELVKECCFVIAGGKYLNNFLNLDLPEPERWYNCEPFNEYPFYKTIGKNMKIVVIPQLDIRATDIRQRVKDGLSIKYLVPDSVERYIENHGLYKD